MVWGPLDRPTQPQSVGEITGKQILLEGMKNSTTPVEGCLAISTGFPGGSEVKASACNAEDLGSIPGSGRPLEKEMASHSSVLAWEIPWTEEPGRLQPMGSQRVRHN